MIAHDPPGASVEGPSDPGAEDRHAFGYRPALDGLRALAVLAVIAYHNDYAWARGGFLGVDAFFVLSGFLITTLLVLEYRRADRIGLIAFWGRRLRRLFPALLLVLVFAAIYARTQLGPFELDRFRWDSISSLFYVTNWRFIASGQSYFDTFTAPSPLRHLWSLAIEEQFYLVWPLVTLACLRLRRGRTDLLVGVCVVGSLASAAAMYVLYDPASPSRAYFGTDTRVHTILVGALLALLLLDRRTIRSGARTAIAGAGVVALAVIVWSWTSVDATARGYYGLGSLAYGITVAVLIAAVMQPGAWIGRALGVGPLRAIGRISYGLYLWHWPIIVWSRDWHLSSHHSVLVAVRVALTFAAATLSYVLVESPIRHGRWFPRGARSTRWVAPVAVVLGASVLVAGSAGAQSVPTVVTAGYAQPCPAPAQWELDEARAELDRAPIPAPASPPTIALLGDSVACSLQPALVTLQTREPSWHFQNHAVIGCGFVSGRVASNADATYVPAYTEQCPAYQARARRDTAHDAPPVALVSSIWERVDLFEKDRVLHAGTSAWRQAVLARYDAAIATLQRAGTRVVIVLVPPPGPGRLGPVSLHPTTTTDRAYARLDRLLTEVARRHPREVSLVDLRPWVCPSGPPCRRHVDGIVPRPVDGAHYGPTGGVWLLRRLLPKLVDIGEASQATRKVPGMGGTP